MHSAKLSVLEGVSRLLHTVSSLPESRLPHCGPAALKCTESAGCSGKKTTNLQYRVLGAGIPGAHLACKRHSAPLFAIYFCQYLSLTAECYCLHKFKKVFLSAGSDARPRAPPCSSKAVKKKT